VGREISRTPGGKGVNVSRVLASLGTASIATGFLGKANRDEFAVFLAGPLVTDEFVVLPGRTRENVTIADGASGACTHIRDVGLPVTAGAAGRLAGKLRRLATPGSVVVFSGSLPPGLRPADFAKLVRLCSGAGARVAVDAGGPALRAAAAHKLWLIKPNVQELAELVGRKLDRIDDQLAAARKLLDHADHVLLSRGADGACLITRDLALAARVRLQGGAVRNTVGCGDVLLGTFLAGLMRGDDAQAALQMAVATAAASACHDLTACFDAKLAESLLAQVELTGI
jgi:1-phosphofructokinase